MKKLQNNFTTQEQSKRLLKLGVPADSADCYHNTIAGKPMLITIGTLFSDPRHQFGKGILPCWSVGRLIEIYDICRCYDGDCKEIYMKETFIETFVSAIEEAVLGDMFDFSKLEE